MTPEQFTLKMEDLARNIADMADSGLPVVIGKTASDFFTDSFQTESFTDEAAVKWQQVKRREDPRAKGARGTRPILTGDKDVGGGLGNSISWDVTAPGEVTVRSDLPYASAHNEGTSTAGRSRSVVIPKRQFIGDSHVLNAKILDEIERKIAPLFE